jgi:membrane-associated phospholipid phosphatase
MSSMGGVNHGSGLVQLAANPYAAMPSLHSADALIVGITMVIVCRHWWSKLIWALWPAWVWFSVMSTGNHFWLDILAGILVAAIAAVVIYRRPILRRLRPAPAAAV